MDMIKWIITPIVYVSVITWINIDVYYLLKRSIPPKIAAKIWGWSPLSLLLIFTIMTCSGNETLTQAGTKLFNNLIPILLILRINLLIIHSVTKLYKKRTLYPEPIGRPLPYDLRITY